MSKKFITLSLVSALLAVPLAVFAADGDRDHDRPAGLNQRDGIRRVLLISIDGMHAVDYQNCVTGHYCDTLAALGKTGVNYPNTSTSKPSDSFPGLIAIVTGGTPRLVGAYYDVAYDRVLAPPFVTTGNGNLAGPCEFGKVNGTTTEYEEGVDFDQSLLNGGSPTAKRADDGGYGSINPARLPRDPFVADPSNGGCAPVFPWNFIRANTIYGVIHKAGGYTAWSDKHGVYAAVSGPTGTPEPSNVDDYYAPDVNSNVLPLPNLTTADGLACSVGNAPNNTPPDPNANKGNWQSSAWTDSFLNIRCYDQLKVNAILHEIDGKDHLGLTHTAVPNIFGMNFQAVSVAQKLIESINGVKVKGGYLDAAGDPSNNLRANIEFADKAIGQMVAELKKEKLFDSTLIVITAKHGQSPIDPARFQEIGAGINTSPAQVLADAGFLPPLPIGGQSENPNTSGAIGPTEDDISLLWLGAGASTEAAVDALEKANVCPQPPQNDTCFKPSQILSGDSLEDMFDKPGIPPFGDPRTPNIIVQPVPGVIYTGSSKKQEEHGGFDHDDTNVMILVSNPSFRSKTVSNFVETRQVAPTILKALGLNPGHLDAVRKEGTQVLPGLDLGSDK
ncbi:MAG: alkaline phosphatase family protein [Acidobacteria bacterium]|nr:alkaline phosphatase family protein [Acidobacteriota bacterium]MBV9435541.1 alkaline phosphatase family protein [Acidobacteriota bacterium]